MVKTPDAGPAPKVVPSGSPIAEASELRTRALAACAKGDFAECLAGLDAARERDPARDGTEEVRAARKKAKEGLGGKGAKGPGREQ